MTGLSGSGGGAPSGASSAFLRPQPASASISMADIMMVSFFMMSPF